MTVSTIWVYTDLTQPEEGHGEPTSTTLELLAKASELADTVVAIVGGSGDAVAATLGAHGASKVLATGDLSGRLPGAPLAAAMAEAIAADAPDAILFGTSYDGHQVHRLHPGHLPRAPQVVHRCRVAHRRRGHG